MERYKLAFCGYGSIAKRHIRNLMNILDCRKSSYTIDLIRHVSRKDNDILPSCINNVFTYEDELPIDYDIIFVTNPTSLHFETIIKYANCTKNLFVEKPIFDSTDLQIPRTLLKDKILYVACPLRYNGVLQFIKRNIDFKNAYAIRSISSSYLPEWREGIDYRNTYSAKKELGGGVSIDLIHEWDYLSNMFGFPDKTYSIIDKVSNLEINSDDVAIYIAKYIDKTIELHLDYFGRQTIRALELYMPDETVIGDIANSEIRFLKSGKIIKVSENRDDFQKRELSHFLDIVNHIVPNDSTWQDALKVLKLTRGKSL